MDKKSPAEIVPFTFLHSYFCNTPQKIKHFVAQWDNYVSRLRLCYVLIAIIDILPGWYAVIKMQFEYFKGLQLSQAQNLVYIQLLAQKSLTAQQFISNGPKKPMNLQKQEYKKNVSLQ